MFRTSRRWLGAALAFAAVALATPAFAAPVDFATFNQPNVGLSPFSFTNNGGVSGTIAYNPAVQVNFNFTSATGLSTVDRAASVTISPGPSTFTPAVSIGGFLDQPLNNLPQLKFTEIGTGKNLLTMTFTGDIVGRPGASVGSITGDDMTGQVVIFTSDYLTFNTPGNSYVLSLQSISPTLSLGAGGFLSSFTANIGGQFRANIVAVPQPTSVAMFGTGLVATAIVARRQRRRLAAVNRSL